MTPSFTTASRLLGRVVANEALSSSMIRLDLDLEAPTGFLPGQFCMVNLEGGSRMPLSRPLSILRTEGSRLSLLYKVVGHGTRLLSEAPVGAAVRVLSPLGRSFPERDDDRPRLLLAGGVGLPPLWSWFERYGRKGDLACFGGRDRDDVPWGLIPPGWRVSLDSAEGGAGPAGMFVGNVVALAESLLPDDAPAHHVLACGPVPLLRAAAVMAAQRGWNCEVSVEERMGCGYGVCRGCVVPRPAAAGWWTACQDGPILAADDVDWERFGLPADEALAAYSDGPSCSAPAPEASA